MPELITPESAIPEPTIPDWQLSQPEEPSHDEEPSMHDVQLLPPGEQLSQSSKH